MECVVVKPFTGGGTRYDRNQLVDASEFRNPDALISQRYIRPATRDEIKTAAPVADANAPEQEKKKPYVPKKLSRRRS